MRMGDAGVQSGGGGCARPETAPVEGSVRLQGETGRGTAVWKGKGGRGRRPSFFGVRTHHYTL